MEGFASVCAPASPTGLLPWGEHAFWRLTDNSIGNSYHLQFHERAIDAGAPIHHQLGTLPLWIWEAMHEHNPDMLPRFVNGLDWHWMNEERSMFNRHAPLTQFIRGYPLKRYAKMTGKPVPTKDAGSDFPGASAVFIHDYACALKVVEEPDPAWREAMMRFSDSWWNRRVPSGLCPRSGGQDAGPALGQTLPLALSSMEVGEMLQDELLLERGKAYADAILNVEQPDTDKGWIWADHAPDGSPRKHSQLWAGNRGASVTAGLLLRILELGDRCGQADRALDLALKASTGYQSEPMRRDLIVRAGDPGLVIALCTELHRRTEDAVWLDAAMLHATDAMELYFDLPLPRMSTGRNHYEAQQGSSVLVHSLARLALHAEGRDLLGGLATPALR